MTTQPLAVTSPQWLVDLSPSSGSPATTVATKSKAHIFPDPPGFPSSTTVQTRSTKQSNKSNTAVAPASNTAVTPRKPPTPEEMDQLKLKKAWELALAPAKQLPMNAIGMYMSGNSLQIFSIMMVMMLFKGPITAMFNINATFQRLESEGNRQQMIMVKLAFVGCNLLALALGIWKVNGMGLLPYVLHLNFKVLKCAIADILTQDYEIGLAGVGVTSGTYRKGVLYTIISNLRVEHRTLFILYAIDDLSAVNMLFHGIVRRLNSTR
jgi:hypothetical protein